MSLVKVRAERGGELNLVLYLNAGQGRRLKICSMRASKTKPGSERSMTARGASSRWNKLRMIKWKQVNGAWVPAAVAAAMARMKVTTGPVRAMGWKWKNINGAWVPSFVAAALVRPTTTKGVPSASGRVIIGTFRKLPHSLSSTRKPAESYAAVEDNLVRLGFSPGIVREARRARVGYKLGGSPLLMAGTVISDDSPYAVTFTEDMRGAVPGTPARINLVACLYGDGIEKRHFHWLTMDPLAVEMMRFKVDGLALTARATAAEVRSNLSSLGLNPAVVDALC